MKKIIISLIVSIACLIGLSISASACPAVPTEQTYSLSNGKTLVATTYGDSGIVLSESAFSWKASLNNCDAVVQLPSGTYRIQNVKSGMYIDGMNGGAQALYQSEYSDEDQQLW